VPLTHPPLKRKSVKNLEIGDTYLSPTTQRWETIEYISRVDGYTRRVHRSPTQSEELMEGSVVLIGVETEEDVTC
jgi:hypothetical protein